MCMFPCTNRSTIIKLCTTILIHIVQEALIVENRAFPPQKINCPAIYVAKKIVCSSDCLSVSYLFLKKDDIQTVLYGSVYIYIYIHVCAYIFVLVCICMHVCIYIYIYIHTHTYACHTRTRAAWLQFQRFAQVRPPCNYCAFVGVYSALSCTGEDMLSIIL